MRKIVPMLLFERTFLLKIIICIITNWVLPTNKTLYLLIPFFEISGIHLRGCLEGKSTHWSPGSVTNIREGLAWLANTRKTEGYTQDTFRISMTNYVNSLKYMYNRGRDEEASGEKTGRGWASSTNLSSIDTSKKDTFSTGTIYTTNF